MIFITFRFQDFTGEDLMQLKRMLLTAPECYYSTLRDKLNISLLLSLRFTKALEKLRHKLGARFFRLESKRF